MGGQGSLYRGEVPAIHNGADDNASGVAVMLQLAGRLKKLEKIQYIIIGFAWMNRTITRVVHGWQLYTPSSIRIFAITVCPNVQVIIVIIVQRIPAGNVDR